MLSQYAARGGDESAFRRVGPLLEGMSKSLRYAGKSGDAAKVKALVNIDDRRVQRGPGGLDKSGIAELTLPGRRPRGR